jgi:hypothetical protein
LSSCQELRKQLGAKRYEAWLKRTNPRVPEQWAYEVLKRFETSRTKRKQISDAVDEIVHILNRHPKDDSRPDEDQESLDQWMDYLAKLTK